MSEELTKTTPVQVRRLYFAQATPREDGGGLKDALDRIKRTQASLEQEVLFTNTFGGRCYVATLRFLENFGAKRLQRKDCYDLFLDQQENLRSLNGILAYTVLDYEREICRIRNGLDIAINRGEALYQTNTDLPQKIKDVAESLDATKESYRGREITKDPTEYFDALRKYVSANRSARATRQTYAIDVATKKCVGEDIQVLLLQEELYETILGRAKEMAVRTELFQRSLEHTLSGWRNIHDVARLMRFVNEGVTGLSLFTNFMHGQYVQIVRDIHVLANSKRDVSTIESNRRDLAMLVSDVNRDAYKGLVHE